MPFGPPGARLAAAVHEALVRWDLEGDVLRLYMDGKSYEEIAATLDLNHSPVEALVELLHEALDDPHAPPRSVRVDSELIVRSSSSSTAHLDAIRCASNEAQPKH